MTEEADGPNVAVAAGELTVAPPQALSEPSTAEPDPSAHFGNLISVYTESIRLCDFKANLTVLFVAIMMGPVIASRAKFPPFLTLPVVLAPFFIAFFCLLMVVFPRFPKKETRNFIVVRNPSPNDFVFSEREENDVHELKLRCAILSGILFWKTLFLKISFFVCLATIAASFIFLCYSLV